MDLKKLIQKNRESFSLVTIAVLLPFIISSVIITFVIRFESQIIHFTTFDWIMFYMVASLCMAMAFTHTTFIALLSGFFMGWSCLTYVILSYLTASLLGYFIANKLDNGKLMHSLISMPKVKSIADNLKNNEFKIIILSRLSPILPFAMMNLVLALFKADLKKYLLGSLIGMLPRTILFIWIGSQARNLIDAIKNGTNNNFAGISFMILLTLSIAGLFYYILRAIRKVPS